MVFFHAGQLSKYVSLLILLAANVQPASSISRELSSEHHNLTDCRCAADDETRSGVICEEGGSVVVNGGSGEFNNQTFSCPDGKLCYDDVNLLIAEEEHSGICQEPRCYCTGNSSFICDDVYEEECVPLNNCYQPTGWGFSTEIVRNLDVW
jgi:hypothetical protein